MWGWSISIPGNLHIRRWGKGSDVIGTKLRFRKGDIIFGRRRAYQRKLAVAEIDGICSAHAMVVRAKPDVVLPEFLPFLMMSDKFMNRAVEISVGSLSPTINWTTLKLEEFDLPPLDQQRRIAEILWAVDEVAVQGKASYERTLQTSLDSYSIVAEVNSATRMADSRETTSSLDSRYTGRLQCITAGELRTTSVQWSMREPSARTRLVTLATSSKVNDFNRQHLAEISACDRAHLRMCIRSTGPDS